MRDLSFSKFHIVLTAALGLFLISKNIMHAQGYQPKANPKAIVTYQNARFTVLTDGLIRMEWSEQKNFDDDASLTFVNRNLDVPQFSVQKNSEFLSIKTDLLVLKYFKSEGPFTKNNLRVTYKDNTESFEWYPEKENSGNLMGTTRTLDACDGEYKIYWGDTLDLNIETGLISKDGWVLIDDSKKPLFDQSDWAWVKAREHKGNNQDWYLFTYGKNFKKALKDFTSIAGHIPVPPKYAFGVWWSKFWPYTELEYRDLVEEYNCHDMPLNVMVMDMDWHITDRADWWQDSVKVRDQANQKHGWTGFTWEKGYFPDPKSFLNWTEKQGVKTCLNLHPASGVQPHEDVYYTFANAMGVDPSTKQYVPFDIVDKNFAKNYFDLLIHPMEKEGIDFWWLDWQQWGTTKIEGVNPTFYLNYVHFSDMQRQGKRPLIYHRWGGLGNHRYQIGFSGDTFITWNSLTYQPYFTATSSNVCFGYWSHDIGGHMLGEMENPELFTRWVQWGTYSPIFRTHGTRDPRIERRMWAYHPKYFNSMREAVQNRISLFPYIYSAAFEAYNTGVSLMRPMYYDYPNQESAYRFDHQYMFGDDMLVAPVTDSIGTKNIFKDKEIWLPEGTWIEEHSGTILKGNQIVKRPYLLSEIPVFVKAGAIIPRKPKDIAINSPIDQLILKIYPGGDASTSIFDDNNENESYIDGSYTETQVYSHTKGNKKQIIIQPIKGGFEGMVNNRSYQIQLVLSYPPKSIKVNDIELEYSKDKSKNTWFYDGQELTTIIQTESYPTKQETKIEIEMADEDINLLSGKPGQFDHLLMALQTILKTWKFEYPITHYFSHELANIAQTGTRITLNPDSITKEIEFLNSDYLRFKEALDKAAKYKTGLSPLNEYFMYLDLP